LISTHTEIYQAQRNFLEQSVIDIELNTHYSTLLERLYKREIPWEQIANHEKVPIEPLPARWKGTYHFEKAYSTESTGAYLEKVVYEMVHPSRQKPLIVNFYVILMRRTDETAPET